MFDDDTLGDISTQQEQKHPCQCPPEPFPFLENILDNLLIFFAVEWTLRVLCYVPPPTIEPTTRGGGGGGNRLRRRTTNICYQCGQWIEFLVSPSTVIDGLATWPYFIETLPKEVVSLRLLTIISCLSIGTIGTIQCNVFKFDERVAEKFTILKTVSSCIVIRCSILWFNIILVRTGDMEILGRNEELAIYSYVGGWCP